MTAGGGVDSTSYLPPLRFHFLTAWYDQIVAATTRSRVWTRRLVGHAAIKPGDVVLDLGCGTGTLLRSLACEPEATLVGLDADDRALLLAAASLSASKVSLTKGLAEHLPFPDDCFDLVVSSLFFHHLSTATKQKVLAEAARVLHPGGRLLVADWGKADTISSAAGFLLVRLLDGFDTTRDSASGAMPGLIAKCGFHCPTELPPLAAPLGVIRIWEARRK